MDGHQRHFVALFGVLVVHVREQRDVLQPLVDLDQRLRGGFPFGRGVGGHPLLLFGIDADRVEQLLDVLQRADRLGRLLHLVGADQARTRRDLQAERVGFGRGTHFGQLADHFGELRDLVSGGPGEADRGGVERADRFPHAQAVCGCRAGDAADRHVADAARGGVDDAAQRLVVARVHDQPNVGEHILDLLALVERHAAVYLIRDVAAAQRLFQRARLRVGAVEYGHVAVLHPSGADGRVDVRREQRRLLFVGVGLDHTDRVAFVGGREGFFADLALVLLDHAVRGVDDRLCRTVVLFQFEKLCAGKVLLEAQDILDLRAAERVDALRVVAHHADVAVQLAEPPDDDVLREVGVLVLVHENVAELVLVLREYLREVAHQDIRVQQQVVEVHRAVLAAFARVQFVNVEELRNPLLAVFGLQRTVRLVGLRRDQVVFRLRDSGCDDVRLVGLVREVQLLDRELHEVFRVGRIVDRERRRVAQLVGFGAQDAGENRVEGAHPQAAAHTARNERRDAFAHLLGGLVRKREREDGVRLHALREHVGDPAGEHARLARAGPGDDQRGPLVIHRSVALGGVEVLDVFRHFYWAGKATCC